MRKKISCTGPTNSSQGRTKISCTGTTSPTNQPRKGSIHFSSLSPHSPQFQQSAGALSSLSGTDRPPSQYRSHFRAPLLSAKLSRTPCRASYLRPSVSVVISAGLPLSFSSHKFPPGEVSNVGPVLFSLVFSVLQ
jgi:hypothetical protein